MLWTKLNNDWRSDDILTFHTKDLIKSQSSWFILFYRLQKWIENSERPYKRFWGSTQKFGPRFEGHLPETWWSKVRIWTFEWGNSSEPSRTRWLHAPGEDEAVRVTGTLEKR